MKKSADKNLLTIAEAAVRLDCSRRTIWRRLQGGFFHPVGVQRRGRLVLLPNHEVEAAAELLNDGINPRQLQTGQILYHAKAILSRCSEASELVEDAHARVLDALEALYLANRNAEVAALLVSHGRHPGHEGKWS